MKNTVLAIIFLLFISLPILAEEKFGESDSKAAPILDRASLSKTTLPPVYLNGAPDVSERSFKEYKKNWRISKSGRDKVLIRALDGGKIKHTHEFWWCFDSNSGIGKIYNEHWSDITELKPSEQKKVREIEEKGVNITVDRFELKSAVDALAWAELYIQHTGNLSLYFSEGSYSGKPIGYKCWSSKPSESMDEIVKRQVANWSLSTKQMIFACQNTMVYLRVSSPSHHEVPVSYIEDVARIIILKL